MSRDGPFSYFKFTDDFKRIFHLNDFIQDYVDFELFLKKFELIKRKAESMHGKKNDSDVLKSIVDKLSLTDKQKENLGLTKVKTSRSINQELLNKFQVAILSYLHFKQNEKETNLKKLKEAQASLPITTFKNEIISSIADNRVTIIAGDTGCGKSTQVPQYLMDEGYTCIACTQPRRLACISLSKRVAYETQNKFGEKVGYQIRFERKRMKDTVIVFITEGLLLRQVNQDGMLSDYNVIVLDEIHERHLHGDFLLGVLKCLICQRDDLKLVLMSATININLFSSYFGGNAKVIQVPGRIYPIKVHYDSVPAEVDKKNKLDPGPYIKILQMIDNKYSKTERGDLLIFVSGLNEINSVIEAVNQYNEKSKRWIPLPLHSSLSIAEQDKVFDYPPEGMRKCIVSTNIAETSVTIDGVRFVIDSGFVKEMSYDPVCKMQRLKEFWVSKASAEQRKGRAGRTGPGVCYRLFTESDYNAMLDYSTPEIQRVPLDSLILQMISMGLPDARKFPFVEPPSKDNIENTIYSLKQHGALTANEKITPMGNLLSKLPVDIPVGKMLISGSMFHQIEPALSVAAALSVQTPMTNRAYRDADCEAMRKDLESDHGDPITLLTCFREWLEVKNARGRGGISSKSWCRQRGLEEQRFYEMCKIRAQFKDLLQDCSLLVADNEKDLKTMSSSERALRHGEVKLLKNLKRAHAEDDLPKRKKYLRPDSWRLEEDESSHDIRDIDFRLRNTQSQLQNLINASTACSFRDLTLLKLIMCSGLYPQIAIADEFNHCKGINEQLFHTQGKPFVFLHPMSYFGNHPETLHLSEAHIVHHPNFKSRAPLSSYHQILFYMSLLETNKPYLVNTLRMPAAETILLFCNEMHTNFDFTKIICDSWIHLTFPDDLIAEKLVQKIVELRKKWQDLTALKMKDEPSSSLETDLSNCLVKVMNFHVCYSIKRLLPADLKTAYVGPSINLHSGYNPLQSSFEMIPNTKVGGTLLTPYLTYDCLFEATEIKDWSCPSCDLNAPVNSLQRLQHLQQSHPTPSNEEKEDTNDAKAPSSSNQIGYFCEVCKKKLFLSAIEILKHKKSHI